MRKLLRYSRITISALSGIVCLLLIALWVRSCSWVDGVNGQVTTTYAIGFGSMPGCIGIRIYPNTMRPSLPGWTWTRVETDRWIDSTKKSGPFFPSRLWGAFYAEGFFVVVPCWVASMSSALIAAAAAARWHRARFSLRTLLIAITMAAAVLGLVVYAAKK